MKSLFDTYVHKFWILLRWMLAGGCTGVLLGLVAGLFGRAIGIVTAYRVENPWMLYLLPLAGLLIVFMYKFDKYNTNTDTVLKGIQEGEYVPLRMSWLIVASTIVTHAFGGSAGREGAALQLGGSVGSWMGKVLKLDESDKKIFIMMGMSAAFSALFGTPLTATIFSMEVVSVGIMQYAALVPCAFAALVAKNVAQFVGCEAEHFVIPSYVNFTILSAVKIILLGLCCAFVCILFSHALHKTGELFKKIMPNPYIRVFVSGCLIVILTLCLQTTDYLGTGMPVIERVIESGQTVLYAFLLKIIYTAITLEGGFKGGEIVPALFIGATFGCAFGVLVDLSPALCAGCGMVAIFCGMTNCPISSLFLSFELFGFSCMPFFLCAIAVSYLESEYSGLYSSQKILYSKEKLKFINIHTNEKKKKQK